MILAACGHSSAMEFANYQWNSKLDFRHVRECGVHSIKRIWSWWDQNGGSQARQHPNPKNNNFVKEVVM